MEVPRRGHFSPSPTSVSSPKTQPEPAKPRASMHSRTQSTRKRALPVSPLPPQLAWLELTTLDVTAHVSRPKNTYRRVQYLLTVTYTPRGQPNEAGSRTWLLLRSFDEYRAFQKRVLRALRRGHFCEAECPWLYTFVKSYFPKTQLLGATLSRVVARRRKTLTRSLATLQTFLLNRSNHCCPLVTQAVARELLDFVVGPSLLAAGDDDDHPLRPLLALLSATESSLEASFASFEVTEDSGASDGGETTSSEDATICGLCDAGLGKPPRGYEEEERPEDEEEGLSATGETPREMAAAGCSTLSCGHQFHDECLIDKLNEALQCPTCGHEESW